MMSEFIASMTARIERWKHLRTAPRLVLAFLLGAGLASAPALGLGQGKGKIPQLPSNARAVLGGDAITLVRVLKQDDAVDTYATGTNTFRDENPPAMFDIPKDTPGDTIEVSASVPIDYLLQFDQSADPVEVIGVSILLRAGSSTCIWDCYWSGGKRICECIRL